MSNSNDLGLSRRQCVGAFLAGAATLPMLNWLGSAQAADLPPGAPSTLPGGPPATPPGGAGGFLPAEFMKDKLPPSSYAKKMFDKVTRAAKYDGAAVLMLSSFSVECQNAYATCVPSGQIMPTPDGPRQMAAPVIVYNPAFMSQIAFASDNEYVPAYVLAHELGHIFHGHVDPNNPEARGQHPWKQELEADEYAGRAIARLKAKASDLELAHRIMVASYWLRFERDGDKVLVVMADKRMRVNSLITGGKTHPDAVKRIQAIAQGWKDGGGEGDVEVSLSEIFTRVAEEAIRWDPGT